MVGIHSIEAYATAAPLLFSCDRVCWIVWLHSHISTACLPSAMGYNPPSIANADLDHLCRLPKRRSHAALGLLHRKQMPVEEIEQLLRPVAGEELASAVAGTFDDVERDFDAEGFEFVVESLTLLKAD